MTPPALQLTSTDGRGYLFPLGAEAVRIGRAKDNTLPLNDDAASRYHCVIESDGMGGAKLRDLGSRNGTRVNNQKVIGTEQALKPGDAVKIGAHTFVIEGEAEEARGGKNGSGARRKDGGDGGGGGASAAANAALEASWQEDIRQALMILPPKGEGDDKVVMVDSGGEASTVLAGDTDGAIALRLLLLLAAKSRATDIHLEPRQDKAHARVRVDGQMVAVADMPSKVAGLVVGIIKAACQMRMSHEDAVLDGHFSTRLKNRRVDYRVSITPSVHGQKLVIRVLDAAIAPRSLSELGLPAYMHERVKRACQKEQGFVLVCGPTGSGKTTTLYNALREIDRDTSNVVTIEDPVEYQLEGTTQIPIDEKRGNSFSQLLRSVLRQDPDVILVGEIRDEETARTAMQAAMTGHLVFSTVHSKDSISAVFRLLDLKVEPFLVASSLEVVLAQRLVRTLCENCKAPVRVSPRQATTMGKYLEGKNELFVPVGCGACLRTGYRGRRAIFELLDFTDELRDIVLKEPTIALMKRVIEKGLFTTLQQSGWKLAAEGAVDMEEVERVAGGG
ncbi:N/A [soil metagenome]